MATRKKQITLITCVDCRFRMRLKAGDVKKRDFCGGAQRYIDKCMPIPEFCPLEDAPEEKSVRLDKEDGDE